LSNYMVWLELSNFGRGYHGSQMHPGPHILVTILQKLPPAMKSMNLFHCDNLSTSSFFLCRILESRTKQVSRNNNNKLDR
jgi:hypothetical protein